MATKKKVGRPKKSETVDPKVDPVVEHWKNVVSSKDEIIEDLEQMLDKAYKEQELMLEEVNRFLSASEEGFEGIEQSTGKITYNDVLYHIHFFARAMHHKFGSSTEE